MIRIPSLSSLSLSLVCLPLALSVGACEKSSGSDFSVGGHARSAFPAIDGEPKILIDNPGDGERAPLRYALQPTSGKMVLTMFMKMAMSMGGNSPPEITLPGMRMVADYEVTRASGDRAEYKFAYNEVPELVPTPDANPMVMSQLRSSLEGIRGLRGSGAVTPRGAMLDTEIEMGPGADPQIAQFVESMRQSMRQLVVPLPEEPVGAGAKWTALQHMELNKMEIFQVAQFEMLSRDGDDIALKVSIEQGAPPQKVQAPGMPPGAKVRLDKMRSGGEGQMKISLTALTPTSDVKLDSDIAMTVEAAGEKIDMKMNMTVRMTIAEL